MLAVGDKRQGRCLFSRPDQEYPQKEIDDCRSEENQQRAVAELKREFGPNYDSALKNAKAVLKWADQEYAKDLEQSGLGNWPQLIKALNKIGKELEVKHREANQSGATMRESSLKAFRGTARERINHLIGKMEAEYIAKHGAIDRW